MSKKHPRAWLDKADNRARLLDFLAIVRRGIIEELATLPQEFLDEWKSSNSGSGVFHYAAGHAANPQVVVPYLASRGVDPNAVNLKGAPVMIHALNRSKDETLEWCQALEQAGARADLMPCKGVSLLVAGVQANRPELVRWVVARGATRTYPDASIGRFKLLPDQVKILNHRPDRPLPDGAQALEDLLPPTQDDLDRQLLLSVRLGYFLWAEHFLAQGANLRAQDTDGNTLLHDLADRIGSYRRLPDQQCMEWVRRAAAAGVSIGAPNKEGLTAAELLSRQWDMKEMVPDFLRQAHEGAAEHLAGQTSMAVANHPRPRF